MTSTTDRSSEVVERVSDRIHRIELPLPFDDLEIVNCYAIVGDRGVTLVDPGWSSEESETVLVGALRELGADRADVRRTLVTHGHPDHITLAFAWQEDHGIPLHLGADERPSVAGIPTTPRRFPRQAELLVRAGATALARVVRDLPLEDYEQTMRYGLPAVWVTGAQVIDCDGVEVAAHHTPGHTRGHMVFEETSTGALFTGDHLLPGITPAIGFELEPEERPLRNYLSSLKLLLGLRDGRMLPAHGPVTAGVHARTRELLEHHEARFATIRSLLATGLTTAAEIAAAMGWTRRERALSELNDVHRMTAIIEVQSHLEVCELRGEVTRTRVDGVDLYQLR
jgi:glyoxylase-like metal-dependent hydrolase (beta-lactamase superfamily II)